VKKEQAEQVATSAKQYAPNKPIDIVYLFTSDKIPIEYKYAALQVNKIMIFSLSSFLILYFL